MSRTAAPKRATPVSLLLLLLVGSALGSCVASTSGSGGGTGGQPGAAGQTGAGGSTTTGTGGAINGSGGSRVGTGGSPVTGGSSGTGGGGMSTGSGGAAGRAGGTGGVAGRAGQSGTGGRVGTGGTTTGAGPTPPTIPTAPPPNCGSAPINQNPFGCPFAWGQNNPGGALTAYTYLQFMSFWVGSDVSATGTFTTCAGCRWLSTQVSNTNLIPVYYAYFIGYLGHKNGLQDANSGNPAPYLTTGGADLIRSQRANIISMFTYYAQQSYAVWPTRPLVWLLDGDFSQYAVVAETNPLTYAELGQLASDITCAIKANMPNAVVAIDHSTWLNDQQTNAYWVAMNNAYYDMVWTTGMGNASGFFDAGTAANATAYNHATATYAYLHKLTGRTIFVDTSFAASAMADSWSTAAAADLNGRIADGVIAANITGTVPATYSTAIAGLQPSLTTTCH